MELITADRHGWQALRVKVFRRDGQCLATRRDVFGEDRATGSCRSVASRTGPTITAWDLDSMEWDHVREKPGGARIDDEAHGITVCPWHHRGSDWRIDTSERRAAARRYLASLYPDVWAGVPLAGS